MSDTTPNLPTVTCSGCGSTVTDPDSPWSDTRVAHCPACPNPPSLRSPYTGHLYSCPTYDTVDESDCTCPTTGPSLDWEAELLPPTN